MVQTADIPEALYAQVRMEPLPALRQGYNGRGRQLLRLQTTTLALPTDFY